MGQIENTLKQVEDGNIPSPFGEIQLELNLEPISQGSSSKQKSKLRTALKNLCQHYKFLLSGDVQIEIQWMVNQQYRYEYHKAPDIDNIIKPLLDSMCGKEGLIIDDTQVQYIGSYWMDWANQNHQLKITVKYLADDYVLKSNLIFIEFDKGLCLPINHINSNEATIIIIEALQSMIEKRKEFDQMGLAYHSSRMVLPTQRFFHRNKLTDYKVLKVRDFITELK
ncbi:MAG: RusA family crossover junction endodeoxyribonuclease [Cyclobacteriaceae bacterium]|nr:RusA family crossover junction endodeoxyribonuclease [Cyclobacteriaceae bacterium]